MPRACVACIHPDRDAIDAAIVAGRLSNRRIVDKFKRNGALSESGLRRHRDDHVRTAMVEARAVEALDVGGDLLGQVRYLRGRALAILDKAEDAHDYRTALVAIREARACIELLAEIEGELDRRGPVMNVIVSSEWLTIRTAVLTALDSFPAARQAVASELQRIDMGPQS